MESRWRLAEAGLQSLSRAASSAVMLFDRQGRLVTAEGVTSHSRASLGGCGDWSAGRRIEAFDSDSGHANAALPDWLRPEWVQPVMRGGQRLGTVVVLPDPLLREPIGRIVDSGGTTFTVGQTSTSLGPIIGRSTALRQALERAKHLADLDVPVLLQGETGVGKEIFARAIHENRQGTKGPFVAVNCGGLPRDILASELFGYVDGAFTGAKRSGMIGKIESARGGTLFLDEIGEMPLELQPYLLRVLEGGELYPLGASQPRHVEFKLIAASNRDLRAEVAAGRFRQDLFYRVSVTTLRIPALRERKEDIAELVEHFNREVSHRHGVSVKRLRRTSSMHSNDTHGPETYAKCETWSKVWSCRLTMTPLRQHSFRRRWPSWAPERDTSPTSPRSRRRFRILTPSSATPSAQRSRDARAT